MATPNIVPRADGEGSIGTSLKKWAKGYLNALFINNVEVLPDTTPTASSIPIADANGKIDSEWIKDASETVKGVVELASPAEVLAGEDDERAVTPAGFKAALNGYIPRPTSSSLPVGVFCLCFNMGSSDIPNGGIIAGSDLGIVTVISTGTPGFVVGGTLSGTWKNITGKTIADHVPISDLHSGLFVRIA